MKKTTLIIIVFLLSKQVLTIAQENAKQPKINKLGITFSAFGDNIVYRKEELVGAASVTGDNFFVFGINYLQGLNKWLEIETAVEVGKYQFTINSNLPPEMESTSSNKAAALVSIPLTLRANFLKYFYINGGIMLDMDVSGNNYIDDQTGIGTITGIAAKYDFKQGVSLFINPYVKFHSLLPFSIGENHQMIYEDGFRFGITYNLSIKK